MAMRMDEFLAQHPVDRANIEVHKRLFTVEGVTAIDGVLSG